MEGEMCGLKRELIPPGQAWDRGNRADARRGEHDLCAIEALREGNLSNRERTQAI
jgi:hypothetical protein